MAVPKKDQERVGYAWMYGAQALKDGAHSATLLGGTRRSVASRL